MKFKEFYEAHSRVIGKMLTNHFGAAFLGLVMALPTSRINGTVYFLTSVLSILFLLYLNHTVLWEDGAKARIRVEGGREDYQPLTGLKMALIAEIPALVLCFLDVVVWLLCWENGPFRLTLKHWIFTLPMWAARLWQGMFLGFIQGTIPNSHLLLFLSPGVIIGGAFLSYWLGLRNLRVFALQETKKPDKKKKEEKTSYDLWRERTKPGEVRADKEKQTDHSVPKRRESGEDGQQ